MKCSLVKYLKLLDVQWTDNYITLISLFSTLSSTTAADTCVLVSTGGLDDCFCSTLSLSLSCSLLVDSDWFCCGTIKPIGCVMWALLTREGQRRLGPARLVDRMWDAGSAIGRLGMQGTCRRLSMLKDEFDIFLGCGNSATDDDCCWSSESPTLVALGEDSLEDLLLGWSKLAFLTVLSSCLLLFLSSLWICIVELVNWNVINYYNMLICFRAQVWAFHQCYISVCRITYNGVRIEYFRLIICDNAVICHSSHGLATLILHNSFSSSVMNSLTGRCLHLWYKDS